MHIGATADRFVGRLLRSAVDLLPAPRAAAPMLLAVRLREADKALRHLSSRACGAL